MKSAVIVQARFGSTRLPGKVLLRLGSKTVLAHVLERCAQIAADVVVCAVPTGPQDDRVAEEAASCGAYVTRGDEQDVLSRYADAARAIGADVVMRVTSDCPLIEPSLCTKVIEIVRRGVADYACNNMPRSFAHGLDCEAFLASTLFEAERQTVDPYDREHVTPWIRRNDRLRRVNLWGPGGAAAQQRITLDTPQDYEAIRAIVGP